jgi:hypothetical protein
VAAVQALDESARQGDRGAVFRLLGPRTRARLVEDARRASEQAGRRRVAPEELVGAGWTPPRWEIRRARQVEREGDRAVVEVEGPEGQRERIEVVRDAGWWRVELP